MNVLAVALDGNVIDKISWLAKWNPDIDWGVIGVSPDCLWEPLGWADSFDSLDCEYRETRSYPQGIRFGWQDYSLFAYEAACKSLSEPFLGHWFHYDIEAMLEGIGKLLNVLEKCSPDIVVIWGERGWYNEAVKDWAAANSIPLCHLERSIFPGLYVADGTGLEQDNCELAYWHRLIESFTESDYVHRADMLQTWLPLAQSSSVELQPRTTLGQVFSILDGRPAVFVPLQVPVDTNMVFRNGDYDNWTLLEYVQDNYYDHQIIVKKHPADGFTNDSVLQHYCDVYDLALVGMNTHAILPMVQKVVSINSQVIIEAWMHGTEVEILGQPAFDLPDEPDKQALLYTLRFAYYIEPWQLTERLGWIINSNV